MEESGSINCRIFVGEIFVKDLTVKRNGSLMSFNLLVLNNNIFKVIKGLEKYMF